MVRMTERFIVDDAGTLIDMQTRDMFDIVEEVCPLLNELSEENEQLKKQLSKINRLIDNKIDEFKNGDYGDLPCNTIHMFLDLKEEIGDVE